LHFARNTHSTNVTAMQKTKRGKVPHFARNKSLTVKSITLERQVVRVHLLGEHAEGPFGGAITPTSGPDNVDESKTNKTCIGHIC